MGWGSGSRVLCRGAGGQKAHESGRRERPYAYERKETNEETAGKRRRIEKAAGRWRDWSPPPWEPTECRGNSPGRGSRRWLASPLPCGVRVAAAPSDLDSGQWRCRFQPSANERAGGGPIRARCADLVVEEIGYREGSRVRAGTRRGPREWQPSGRALPRYPDLPTRCHTCGQPGLIPQP